MIIQMDDVIICIIFVLYRSISFHKIMINIISLMALHAFMYICKSTENMEFWFLINSIQKCIYEALDYVYFIFPSIILNFTKLATGFFFLSFKKSIIHNTIFCCNISFVLEKIYIFLFCCKYYCKKKWR